MDSMLRHVIMSRDLSKTCLMLITLILCSTWAFSQTVSIEQKIELSPSITQSLPQVFIRNNTNETIDITSLSISLKSAKGVEWRLPDPNDPISAQMYQRKGENAEVGGYDIGRYLKWTGIYFLWDNILSWKFPVYSIQAEKERFEGRNIVVDGSKITLSYDNTNVLVLAPNQGVILNNLPIIVSQDIEDGKIGFDFSISGIKKGISHKFSLLEEVSTFIPSSQFTGDHQEHLSFLYSKSRHQAAYAKVIKDKLRISCLSTEGLLKSGHTIAIRLKNNNGQIEWKRGHNPKVSDGNGEPIKFTQSIGDRNGSTLLINLQEDVKSKIIEIENLSIRPKVEDHPLIQKFPLEVEIRSTNTHRFPVQQEIHFGNPKFEGDSALINLLPYQESITLPPITIIEDPRAAGINKNDNIIFKLVTDTELAKMETQTVFWSQSNQGLKYSGTASSKMGFQLLENKNSSQDLILNVDEDFLPGDDLAIEGIELTTLEGKFQKDITILASFDGGISFVDVFGEPNSYPGALRLLNPNIEIDSESLNRFLLRGEESKFPIISVKNMGNNPVFKSGDILLISFADKLGVGWGGYAGQQPKVNADGIEYVSELSILSRDEIRLELKKSIPPGREINISNLSLSGFPKRGKSSLTLALSEKPTSPIAVSSKRIDVTVPNVNSVYEQIISPHEHIQALSGIQITKYEQLGFQENGILIRLPKNMGLRWHTTNFSDLKLFANGSSVPHFLELNSDHQLLIRPRTKLEGKVFIHDLMVELLSPNESQVDTGRLGFSFNNGISFSSTDQQLLRYIEAADQYSLDIRKYHRISSNFNPEEEVILFLHEIDQKNSDEGRRKPSVAFKIMDSSALRFSSDYNNPVQMNKISSATGAAISIRPDKSISQPQAFIELSDLHVSGTRDDLAKVQMGVRIHNYSGFDTVFINQPLYGTGNDIMSSGRSLGILPELNLRIGNLDRQGGGIKETLVLENIQIRNPIMPAKESARIRALSGSNVQNIQTYIELGDFDEADKEISKIILYSRHYWLGYWLNHNLYAVQQEIEKAQGAIEDAERYGWVSTSKEFPKHLELSKSPIERARAHFHRANNYYQNNAFWESDSILTAIERNYITSGLLERERGGQPLIAEIYTLMGKVSEEFKDYNTSALYFLNAADYADDYDLLETYAVRADFLNDSLSMPYKGVPETIRLRSSYINMDISNPSASRGLLRVASPGMQSYPLVLANEVHEMNKEITIQGGLNYRLDPSPMREEIKRMGGVLLLSGTLLSLIVYNQGL